MASNGLLRKCSPPQEVGGSKLKSAKPLREDHKVLGLLACLGHLPVDSVSEWHAAYGSTPLVPFESRVHPFPAEKAKHAYKSHIFGEARRSNGIPLMSTRKWDGTTESPRGI